MAEDVEVRIKGEWFRLLEPQIFDVADGIIELTGRVERIQRGARLVEEFTNTITGVHVIQAHRILDSETASAHGVETATVRMIERDVWNQLREWDLAPLTRVEVKRTEIPEKSQVRFEARVGTRPLR